MFADFCVRVARAPMELPRLSVRLYEGFRAVGLGWDVSTCAGCLFFIYSTSCDSIVSKDKLRIRGRRTHATPKHIPLRSPSIRGALAGAMDRHGSSYHSRSLL